MLCSPVTVSGRSVSPRYHHGNPTRPTLWHIKKCQAWPMFKRFHQISQSISPAQMFVAGGDWHISGETPAIIAGSDVGLWYEQLMIPNTLLITRVWSRSQPDTWPWPAPPPPPWSRCWWGPRGVRPPPSQIDELLLFVLTNLCCHWFKKFTSPVRPVPP